jgi:hypothetical protein
MRMVYYIFIEKSIDTYLLSKGAVKDVMKDVCRPGYLWPLSDTATPEKGGHAVALASEVPPLLWHSCSFPPHLEPIVQGRYFTLYYLSYCTSAMHTGKNYFSKLDRI